MSFSLQTLMGGPLYTTVETKSYPITAANIVFTKYALVPESAVAQYVLLLHGWMGSATDLAPIADTLAKKGYDVLVPDLPLHGKSIGASPETMTQAADMIFAGLDCILPMGQPYPIAIAGYSMGGRLAFEMATLATERHQCRFDIKALILISSAPSPRADVEMEREFCASKALEYSEMLRDLDAKKQLYHRWLLRSWYASSMWGSISKAPGFGAMISSKVTAFDKAQRDAWCDAAISMSRATMTEPSEKLHLPTLYICGMRDANYLSWSAEIIWFLSDFQCVQVHEAGHNVILEKPDIVQSCITEFLNQTYAKTPFNQLVEIHSIRILRYSLPLKEEIIVNGEILPQRDGVLVALLSKNGSFGVGDICPLPGVHEETLTKCLDELSYFADRIQQTQTCLTFWALIDSYSPLHGCSPATRSGIEAAFLHLLSKCMGLQLTDCMSRLASRLEPRLNGPLAAVSINGVLPRMTKSEQLDSNEPENAYHEYVAQSAFDTLKLKVGASDDLEHDGLMVREATSAATRHGKRVRLDANRSWTTEDFNTFLSAMKDSALDVEFIEEPLTSSDELETYLTSAANSNNTISVALDESLAAGLSEQVRRMASSNNCKALVLKPCVIGSMRQVIDLTSLALDSDCEVILSTCFESGVGLAWTTVLASVFGRNPSRHGLGTYSYIEKDVLSPSFGSQCVEEHCSHVVISRCEAFLERAGQQVVNTGVPPSSIKGGQATTTS